MLPRRTPQLTAPFEHSGPPARREPGSAGFRPAGRLPELVARLLQAAADYAARLRASGAGDALVRASVRGLVDEAVAAEGWRGREAAAVADLLAACVGTQRDVGDRQ